MFATRICRKGPKMSKTRRRRPTQERSQSTVDAILTAGARVLVERGYAKTTTNHIARVAGVSIGSLYQYFGNKDELVLAIINRHAENILELLRSMTSDLADAPIAVAVNEFVSAMITAHSIDPKLHRICVEQVLNLGLEHLLTLRATAIELVRAYLTAKRNKIVVEDIDTAAYMLVVTVDSVIHSAFIGDAMPNLGRLNSELVSLILRYLGLPSNDSVADD